MITDTHAALLVAVMAIVTALLRFLPFLVFGKNNTPSFILYLGRVLPFAIMGMLADGEPGLSFFVAKNTDSVIRRYSMKKYAISMPLSTTGLPRGLDTILFI